MADTLADMTMQELAEVQRRCDETKARALALQEEYLALGAMDGRFVHEFNGALRMQYDANRLWNQASERMWEIRANGS